MTTFGAIRWVVAAVAMGLAWTAVSPRDTAVLRADPVSPTQDTDGDFLPDIVEWASLSNSQSADTDSDGNSDLLEFLQRTSSLRVNAAAAMDHEMRAVVTSHEVAGGAHLVSLHLFFRFLGDPTLAGNVHPWIEFGCAPGMRFPLDLLSPGVTVEHRVDPVQGHFARVSTPLVDEQVLRMLLPCTFGVDATIGTKQIQSTVPVFDVGGITSTLVPYPRQGLAIQSIGRHGAFSGGGTNRVCVLSLQPWQQVPGGTAYVCTHADCEDCNDLECGTACPLTEGWIFVLPGGLQSITGG